MSAATDEHAPSVSSGRLSVSLVLAAAGVASSVAGRSSPVWLVGTAAFWLAAIVAFASTWAPWLLGRCFVTLLITALVTSVAATVAWSLVPVAMVLWVAVAWSSKMPWTWLLVAGVGTVGAAATATAVGLPALAEDLALTGYALAFMGCGLALAPGSDLRTPTRARPTSTDVAGARTDGDCE
ncbi:MAG TPA: hypothetical protein VM242_05015 [Acidimicrobiales bacterium]|nr:hypothetical protein [Acidimicrobiales bacterium]